MLLLRRHWSVGLVVLFCIVMAQPARAVPPPDFIINVGSQMLQFFSLALLFLTAIFSSFNQYLRVRFGSMRMKAGYWVAGLMLIVVLSGVGARVFGAVLEERALAALTLAPELKKEENLPEQVAAKGTTDLDHVLVPSKGVGSDVPLTLSPEATAVVTTSAPEDRVALFIRQYYQAIATRDFHTAYNRSRKSVSYQTFASWYATTKAVTISKLQRIDATRSSLELLLDEATGQSHYAVTMEVEVDREGKPVRIASSSARLIGVVQPAPTSPRAIALDAATTTLPFKLPNERLQALLQQAVTPYLVVDARENIEHEYGSFPGSVHIRYADLKAGRWIELPTDRPIIVLCWSGIRGSQVASFLREKGIAASYLIDGANGWVAAGGIWNGSVKFADKFPEERYRIAFSKEEATRRVQGGALLIDAREPATRATAPLANSTPISLLSTPSAELATLIAGIPAGKAVITVCSEYVDCFEAKLVGVELERQGHPFLGRYVYIK